MLKEFFNCFRSSPDQVPNKGASVSQMKLETLIKENELKQINRTEMWKKYDNIVTYFAIAVSVLITQINNMPKWIFLLIPVGFFIWALFLTVHIFDTIVPAKYLEYIRQKIDDVIGDRILMAEDDLSDIYWSPSLSRNKLNIVNPRVAIQRAIFISLIMIYLGFCLIGIDWLSSIRIGTMISFIGIRASITSLNKLIGIGIVTLIDLSMLIIVLTTFVRFNHFVENNVFHHKII